MAGTKLNTRNDTPKFTLFPNLATELKLKIWGFAVPGPRIIVVKVFAAQTMYDPEFLTPNEQARQDDPSLMRTLTEDASKRVTLSTKTKNPGLLFACKTSREISLKHLSACMDLGSGKLARIDPLNDTIILCHLTMIGCLSLPGILEKSGRLEEWLEYTNAWKTISETVILLLGMDSILELRDNISAIPKIPEITVMKLFNDVY